MDNLVPLPPEEKTNVTALVLAAAVHLLLIGALFFGVQWKSQPTAVEVEVWRSVAAPVPMESLEPKPEPPKPEPKPEPLPDPKPAPKVEPPAPVKPDIAVKDKEKPKKEEPKKPEPPKKEEPKKPEPKPEVKREEPDWKKALDQEQRQLQQHKVAQDQRARAEAESNLMDKLKAEQASAARQRGLADYAAKIRGKIKGNMNITGLSIQGNPEAVFKVTQLPSGEVLSVKLTKSSGNRSLDEAIERAILKSSPLPKPDQVDLFRRELELKYKPFDE